MFKGNFTALCTIWGPPPRRLLSWLRETFWGRTQALEIIAPLKILIIRGSWNLKTDHRILSRSRDHLKRPKSEGLQYITTRLLIYLTSTGSGRRITFLWLFDRSFGGGFGTTFSRDGGHGLLVPHPRWCLLLSLTSSSLKYSKFNVTFARPCILETFFGANNKILAYIFPFHQTDLCYTKNLFFFRFISIGFGISSFFPSSTPIHRPAHYACLTTIKQYCYASSGGRRNWRT